MSIKMKKSDLVIAASIIAVILAGLLAGFASCHNGLTTDNATLALPPKLPYARIIEGRPYSAANNLGWNDTRFVLDWKIASGILPYDKQGHQQEITDVLEATLEKWNEYMTKINPQPFKDDVGDGLKNYGKDTAVFESSGTGPNVNYAINEDTYHVVIHRYWPASEENLPTDWDYFISTEKARAEAYKKTVD